MIYHADCRSIPLPDGVVQCVVTSPPYYGLRDYGVEGQIGLEETPEAYLETMVQVFREVRRILRDDGMVWLNMGSSYSSGVHADLTDCFNALLEQGSIFFGDASAITVTSHRVEVSAHNERTPEGIFPSLLRSKRECVKERDENFGAIGDSFAQPSNRRICLAAQTVAADVSDAKMLAYQFDHRRIVVADGDTQGEAKLGILRTPSGESREHNERAFTINQSDEPCVKHGVCWHSVWHTFASDAIGKGIVNIDAVNDAVSLRNRLDTFAGFLSDFRVTQASEQKVTLRSVVGGVSITVSDVGHLWFCLRNGSIVPYPALYKQAICRKNEYSAKQDMVIPWRLVLALIQDGWILRSPIIWAKPNPMPESVTDRPTRSHEYIFLLAKSANYFYDSDAIREEASPASIARIQQPNFANQTGGPKDYANGINPSRSMRKTLENFALNPGRNKRDVWTINSEPTPEAHFATFPQKLVEPCILAGTSAKGCCSECGAPYVREIDFVGGPPRGIDHRKRDDFDDNCKTAHTEGTVAGSALSRIYAKYGYPERKTTGWRATCTHDAPIIPCLVFDPFLGSGTVGVVCERLGRRWAGTELSAEYIEIARKRTAQQGLFSREVAREA